MADKTQRMISLLGAMRKQMNGAVADSMHYYGDAYGLNYGVSLPTVREIAQREPQDNELALYLYKQQVRELRLAALHIAAPESLSIDSLGEWAEGIINSEVAEEMAFALLRHAKALPEIFNCWIKSDNELLAYTALRAAATTSIGRKMETIAELKAVIEKFHFSRIIAQATVAVLATAYECDVELRSAIVQFVASLGDSLAGSYIKEEMGWRMDFLQ